MAVEIRINIKGASLKRSSVVQISRYYPAGVMTVEEFIAETVRQSVAEYNERHRVDELLCIIDHKEPDLKDAIDNALQSFEDGIIALFVDGHRCNGIKEGLILHNGSEVTFIRLTFLAGRMW